MKHRDAYTLEGGNTMQHTSFGRLARCLMAVFVVVSSFALLACPGDDDEEFRDLSATVPASANSVAAVQGQAITIPSGAVFNSGTGAVNVTFTSANMATLSRTGATTSNATVTFASCTFVVLAGGFVPAGTYSFPTCNFVITANDVEVGGDEIVGQLILILINAAGLRVDSLPLAVEVRIDSNGNIFVNDVDTGVDSDVTGTTGTTGG